MKNNRVAFITGGARRIGAAISEFLVKQGLRVAIHCHTSLVEAQALADQLNHQRQDCAMVIQGNLKNSDQYAKWVNAVLEKWQRLDVLVHNASAFYPTPCSLATPENFDDLFLTNVKAPFFLTQAVLLSLKQNQGCVINITDIHAEKPLRQHSLYSMTKAGLKMMTAALAKELAPQIRVNAIAPGAVLWPEQQCDREQQAKIIEKIALKRQGTPLDIAKAVWFLIESNYITGQTIRVDGGRVITPF